MSTTCKTYAVPGPAGLSGAPGAAGADGVNAFTTVTTQFTMPTEGNTVVAAVGSSEWMSVGQALYISGCGTMIATGFPSTTSVTLRNPAVAASGIYPGNVAGGSLVSAANTVSAAGVQGPVGVAAAGGLLAANNLSDVASIPTARSNLGVGTAGEQSVGYFLQQSLNLGDVASVATSRTNLGLGTMATQNASAVNISGGSIVVGPIICDDLDINNSFRLFGTLLYGSSQQTMNAGDSLLPVRPTIYIRGNGAPVTITSVPSVNASFAGTLVYISGFHATNTVTLQDESVLPGSKLKLAAATRVITESTTLVLTWNSWRSKWYEVSFTTVI